MRKFSNYDLGMEKPEASLDVIDSTKLKCFCSCERMFFYEYVLGWRSPESVHLAYGKAIHDALHEINILTNVDEAKLQDLTEKALLFDEALRTMLARGITITNAVKACIPLVGNSPIGRFYDSMEASVDPHKNATKGVLSLIKYVLEHCQKIKWFQHEGEPAVEIGGSILISDDIVLSYRLDGLAVDEATGNVYGVEYKTGKTTPYWLTQWDTDIQFSIYNLIVMLIGGSLSFVLVKGLLLNNTKLDAVGKQDINDPYRHVILETLQIPRTALFLENFVSDVRILWTRLHENFQTAEKCKNKEVLETFPRNYRTCNAFYGRPCPYLYYCLSTTNPLRDVLERGYKPAEFEVRHWNPLDDVRKVVSHG